MAYNRVDRNITKNVKKLQGGQVFQKALRHTLVVKKFVEARVLKCKQDSEPIKCAMMESGAVGGKAKNWQPTVNKCLGAFCRKANAKSLSVCSEGVQRSEVPPKFFCLPCFDCQSERQINTSPQEVEDASEFSFVDLPKFLLSEIGAPISQAHSWVCGTPVDVYASSRL